MLHDVRYAIRTFARRPSFAVAAIVTLALGIAVNTIAFSVVNSLLLRPMPVPYSGRVVRVYPVDARGHRGNVFSYPDYLEYRAAASPFDALAGYSPAEMTAGSSTLDRGAAAPRVALAYVVSASYFEITGVRPALGRVLQPADERDGGRIVVLGHGFWQTRLGADPAAVGSSITLNGTPFTIVGVAQPEFAGTEPLVADCWIPLSQLPIVTADPRAANDRGAGTLLVIGRLKPDTTRSAAARALTLEAGRLALAYPGRERPASVQIASGTFFTIDPGLKPIIAGVMTLVGLVLLIACANAANLALARAASRQREIALRLAIGAGRARIVRQLLVEAVLVGVASAAAALLAAVWSLRALYRVSISVAALPWAIALNLEPDVRVFACTAIAGLVSGAVLGLLPALQASSPRLVDALHDGAVLGGRVRGSRLRHALVVAQVAASFVLLLGAGLLLRGLRSAETLDVGFKTAGVIYTEYDARSARLAAPRAAQLTAALVESARAIPGVTHVALTSHVPLHGGVRWSAVRLVGATGALAEQHAIVSSVSPEYFATLGIPFVSGRSFDAPDVRGLPAAIISEGLARRFWPGQMPIGKAVSLPGQAVPRTIVGVVRDAANAAIWREKELAIYLPVEAATDPRDLQVLVRTTGDQALVGRVLAGRAAALAPELRFAPAPLDDLLRLWTLPSKVAAAGVGILAALAFTLACIGLYGVLTFAVTARTREMGIRMALGADAGALVRLILGDAWTLVGAGLAIGTIAGLAAAPLLGNLLFGIRPYDPLTLAIVAAILIAVTLGTAYVPARRAARLEPLVVLRTE
jgi:predicted permease